MCGVGTSLNNKVSSFPRVTNEGIRSFNVVKLW